MFVSIESYHIGRRRWQQQQRLQIQHGTRSIQRSPSPQLRRVVIASSEATFTATGIVTIAIPWWSTIVFAAERGYGTSVTFATTQIRDKRPQSGSTASTGGPSATSRPCACNSQNNRCAASSRTRYSPCQDCQYKEVISKYIYLERARKQRCVNGC